MLCAFYLILVSVLLSVQIPIVDAIQSFQNDVSQHEILNVEHLELMKQADALFEATLYTKAIPIYQKILHDTPVRSPFYGFICGQLTRAFYANNEFQEILALLENNPQVFPESDFYLGQACNKLMRYEQALDAFERFLAQEKKSIIFAKEAQFSYAIALFHLEKTHEAAHFFEEVTDDSLYPLAVFYLSRISIAQGYPKKAIEQLQDLKLTLPPEDPLHYELSYILGEAYSAINDYKDAIASFQNALPNISPELVSWHPNVLRQLGSNYLKIAEESSCALKERVEAFDKAEISLRKLLEVTSKESDVLLLGKCYLAHARLLKDTNAYQHAEELLSHEGKFVTNEAKAQALLLRAGAAPTYQERARFYRYLTQEEHQGTPYYCQGWHLRGINDLVQGEECASSGDHEEALVAWESGFMALQRAFELANENDQSLAFCIMRDLIRISLNIKTEETLLKSLSLLDIFKSQKTDLEECLYFHALVAITLAEVSENNRSYSHLGEQLLQGLLEKFPKGDYAARAQLLCGTLHYLKKDYVKAESCFATAIESFPKAPETAEILMCAARCNDALGQSALSKKYRKQLFEDFPDSAHAAEAYFSYYNFHEYLQGDKPAIKHLLSFAVKYPNSSLIITAHYLIGLDFKRDRRSQEGKWIIKKSLSAAIDSFQRAETAFDDFLEQKKLSATEIPYFSSIKYRATLERALSNLAIAEEAQDAKKKIYLQYAEDVLLQMHKDFSNTATPLWGFFYDTDVGKRLQEENLYWLAQVYFKNRKEEAADSLLAEMLEKYQSAKITRGYLLSRIWYARAQIAMGSNRYAQAKQYLSSAEDTAKGKVLSADQKLDIWIQQSQCHLALKDYDQALLMLSKAVNDDEVSSLRIKAMYMRAEVYEQQGRTEQARRQLDAASKKGGEWARKARDKLERNYGYPSNIHTAYSAS